MKVSSVSLFRWLFPKSQSAASNGHTLNLAPESAALPLVVDPAPPLPQTAVQENARNRRVARREALYGVVRDVMMRAGVLSGGYKFKVLALDQSGIKFLVMVDVAPEYISDAARLGDIEGQLAQEAHVRCRILVTAVYWRANGRNAAGEIHAPMSPPQRPSAPVPANMVPPVAPPPPVSAPVPLVPAPVVPPVAPVEPVEADEVLAFRQALEFAASQRAASSGSVLTGFEDTKAVDPDARESMSDQLSMSTTQYGSLPS